MDTSAACIINELTQGMELARQLKSILSSETSTETKQVLIQEIISSYDRALLIVNWGGGGGQTLPPAQPMLSQPESSEDSPCSEDYNHTFDNQHHQKLVSKKRKAMPTWENHMRISTDDGLEGKTDDGYSWRKYGQKDILGFKFPRSYYRCTYRHTHNCVARKQVQRTDDDPTVFEITYKGKHTCNTAATFHIAPPQSPEKHETKQNNHHHHQQPLPPKSVEMSVITSYSDAMEPRSFSFPSTSFGCIENYQQFHFTNGTDDDCSHKCSPSFVSPATSGSNYFREWGNDFQDLDELNLSGIISTTALATNSSLAFPAALQDLSQNFQFNDTGFFI